MCRVILYSSFLCLVLSIFFFSCGKDEETAYTIRGKLENIQGDVFFAAREDGDTLYVDTIKVNNKGEFSFTGNVDTLTVISLYFKDMSASPYVLVNKGWDVEIKGDVHSPDLILAKGGDINNDLTKFKEENINLIKSRYEIIESAGNNSAKQDSIVNKENVVGLKNIHFELLNVASEYVKNNPTKIASVLLINNLFKNEDSLERLTEALDYLKGAAYDFPMAVQLRAYRDQLKKSAVGVYAPSFRLKDITGKERSLSEFRNKYVLLIFESTTCPLCIEMRPQINKEYDKLKKEKMNVEFVSIVKDVEETPISKEIEKASKWVLLPEYGGWSSQVFENYNIKEIPYCVLISREGKVLERDVTLFNLKSKLEDLPGIKNSISKN